MRFVLRRQQHLFALVPRLHHANMLLRSVEVKDFVRSDGGAALIAFEESKRALLAGRERTHSLHVARSAGAASRIWLSRFGGVDDMLSCVFYRARPGRSLSASRRDVAGYGRILGPGFSVDTPPPFVLLLVQLSTDPARQGSGLQQHLGTCPGSEDVM